MLTQSVLTAGGGVSSKAAVGKGGHMGSTVTVSAAGRSLPSVRYSGPINPRHSVPIDPRIRLPPPPPPHPPPPMTAAPPLPPGISTTQQQPMTTVSSLVAKPVHAEVPKTVAQLLLKVKEEKEAKKKSLPKGINKGTAN